MGLVWTSLDQAPVSATRGQVGVGSIVGGYPAFMVVTPLPLAWYCPTVLHSCISRSVAFHDHLRLQLFLAFALVNVIYNFLYWLTTHQSRTHNGYICGLEEMGSSVIWLAESSTSGSPRSTTLMYNVIVLPPLHTHIHPHIWKYDLKSLLLRRSLKGCSGASQMCLSGLISSRTVDMI